MDRLITCLTVFLYTRVVSVQGSTCQWQEHTIAGWCQADTIQPTPIPRYLHSTVAVNSTLSVTFGGRGSADESLANVVVLNFATNKWRVETSPGSTPQARYGHTAVLDAEGSRVVIHGGKSHTNVVFNDVWLLTTANYHWTQVPPNNTEEDHSELSVCPPRSYQHSSVWYKQQLWVYGGLNDKGQALRSVRYMTEALEWHCVAEDDTHKQMDLSGRYGHTAVLYRDKLMLVFGGVTDDSPLLLFQLDTGEWNRITVINADLPRIGHTSTLIPNTDQLLIVGGNPAQAAADLCHLQTLPSNTITCEKPAGSEISPNVKHHTTIVLEREGKAPLVVMYGGVDYAQNKPQNNLLLYSVGEERSTQKTGNCGGTSEVQCSTNGVCMPTATGFTCTCATSFVGNGLVCVGSTFTVLSTSSQFVPVVLKIDSTDSYSVRVVPKGEGCWTTATGSEVGEKIVQVSNSKQHVVAINGLSVGEQYEICLKIKDSQGVVDDTFAVKLANGKTNSTTIDVSDPQKVPTLPQVWEPDVIPKDILLISSLFELQSAENLQEGVRRMNLCFREILKLDQQNINSLPVNNGENGKVMLFTIVASVTNSILPNDVVELIDGCSVLWISAANSSTQVSHGETDTFQFVADTDSTTRTKEIDLTPAKSSLPGGTVFGIIIALLLALLLVAVGGYVATKVQKKQPISFQQLKKDVATFGCWSKSGVLNKDFNGTEPSIAQSGDDGVVGIFGSSQEYGVAHTPRSKQGRSPNSNHNIMGGASLSPNSKRSGNPGSPLFTTRSALEYLTNADGGSPCSLFFRSAANDVEPEDVQLDFEGAEGGEYEDYNEVSVAEDDEPDVDEVTDELVDSISVREGHNVVTWIPKTPPNISTPLPTLALGYSTPIPPKPIFRTPLPPLPPPDRIMPTPGSALPGALLVAPILTSLCELAAEENDRFEQTQIAAQAGATHISQMIGRDDRHVQGFVSPTTVFSPHGALQSPLSSHGPSFLMSPLSPGPASPPPFPCCSPKVRGIQQQTVTSPQTTITSLAHQLSGTQPSKPTIFNMPSLNPLNTSLFMTPKKEAHNTSGLSPTYEQERGEPEVAQPSEHHRERRHGERPSSSTRHSGDKQHPRTRGSGGHHRSPPSPPDPNVASPPADKRHSPRSSHGRTHGSTSRQHASPDPVENGDYEYPEYDAEGNAYGEEYYGEEPDATTPVSGQEAPKIRSGYKKPSMPKLGGRNKKREHTDGNAIPKKETLKQWKIT